MAMDAFQWARTDLTYSISANVNFDRAAIATGFDVWEQISPFTFREVVADADFQIVDLSDLFDALGGGISALAYAITFWDEAREPFLTYVGLDADRIRDGVESWVAAHEIGHGFGFLDDYGGDPAQTMFTLQPGAPRPQARDIEELQARYGASPADNLIIAGNGSGQVSGGAGDDVIYGNQGDDAIYGNTGSDTLFGGQGSDIAFGGQSADIVYGNLGDDVLYGNYGSDIIHGGQGADVLYGGQGADILAGNNGADTLYGGEGADTFVGVGIDQIADFNADDVIWSAWLI